MKIGVLALQGAFIEHEHALKKLGVDFFEIRQKKDINTNFDALIIPGGESTVMGKLLVELDLYDPIKGLLGNDMPVFGTCAGLLLLAKNIANDKRLHFSVMDITAVRNAYGRQLGSFFVNEDFKGIGNVPMTFIRAPYIESVFGKAEALASVNGKIVAAKQKNMLVTAFHPELNDDLSIHKYFIEMVKKAGKA